MPFLSLTGFYPELKVIPLGKSYGRELPSPKHRKKTKGNNLYSTRQFI